MVAEMGASWRLVDEGGEERPNHKDTKAPRERPGGGERRGYWGGRVGSAVGDAAGRGAMRAALAMRPSLAQDCEAHSTHGTTPPPGN